MHCNAYNGIFIDGSGFCFHQNSHFSWLLPLSGSLFHVFSEFISNLVVTLFFLSTRSLCVCVSISFVWPYVYGFGCFFGFKPFFNLIHGFELFDSDGWTRRKLF